MLIMCNTNSTEFIKNQLNKVRNFISEGELAEAYKTIVRIGNQIEFEKSKHEETSVDLIDLNEFENLYSILNRKLLREMSKNL